MPHVKIKTYPLTEEQKLKLTDEVSKVIQTVTGKSESAISIAIEDVPESEWMERVYKSEIKPNIENLYKKPGY